MTVNSLWTRTFLNAYKKLMKRAGLSVKESHSSTCMRCGVTMEINEGDWMGPCMVYNKQEPCGHCVDLYRRLIGLDQ